MHVQSYLFFNGRCDEAMAFYAKAAGATDASVRRYKDSPEPAHGGLPPGWSDKVMHASFKVGSTVIMASDGTGDDSGFGGFALVLTVKDEAAAKRRFDALAAGGTVTQPLIKTFFSPSFGMLTDRFGVGWMVMVDAA